MMFRTLLAALLVSLCLTAAADFVVVSKAYELSLADVRLPTTPSGSVTFKECKSCDYHTVRVTAETRYEVDAQALTLQEFRKSIAQLTDPADVPVTVLHHLESGTVKAIRVWP